MVVHPGGGPVHHYHAGLAVPLEMRSVFQGSDGNACRQAERRIVGRGECGFIVLDADDARYRAKNLFRVEAHAGGAFT